MMATRRGRAGEPRVNIVGLSAADASYPNHRAVLRACGTVLLDHRVSLSGGTLWGDYRLDTLQFTPSTTGACEIRFDVDPDEFQMDKDRANNTAVRTLTVRP